MLSDMAGFSPTQWPHPTTRAIDRVVVISDNSSPGGGAVGIALASVRLLREAGINVVVLTGDEGRNTEISALGADLIGLGASSINQGAAARAALQGLYHPGARAFVADWIAAHDTPRTVYHLHNWHKILSPSVFQALRPVANRLLLSAHDYFLVCPNGGYADFTRHEPCSRVPMGLDCIATHCDKRHYAHKIWRMARHIMRTSLIDLERTPAVVLAVHEGMISHLERGGIRRSSIRVLRNPAQGWTRHRVTAERNRDVFFVGRLEIDKGADVLADACAMAGANLRVIGSGPLRAELEKRISAPELLGWLGPEQIAEVIGDARMLVMPTRSRETFGLVAIEALLSGIPVVASELAPITEEIVQLGIGRSCNPRDASGLAATIRELLDDDNAIHEMSRRAHNLARSLAPTDHDWCEGLLTIYADVLDAAI